MGMINRLKEILKDRFTVGFAAVLVGFLVVQYYRTFGYFVDDGFIMMRYAQNILNGNGWVFNEGELYNAATSILQVILYVIQGFVLGVENLELIAYTNFYIWMLVLGLAIYGFFYKYNKYVAALISLSVILAPHFYRTFGIETVMSMGLLFCALIAYQKGKLNYLYGFLSLLILTRLEFGLFTAFTFLFLFFKEKVDLKNLIRGGIFLSIPFVVWFVFSYFYFGHLFPDTLAAKMWQGDSGDWGDWPVFLKDMFRYITLLSLPWVSTLKVQLANWHTSPKEYWDLLNQNAFFMIALMANFVFFVRGSFSSLFKKELKGMHLFVAWTFFHAFLYGLIFNVPGYPWYHSMMTILVIAATYVGIKEWGWKRSSLNVLILMVFFVPYVAVAKMDTNATIKDVRTEPYRNLANWINENTASDAVIIHEEVGEIAFLTDRQTIDTVALTNPQYLPLLERRQRGIFWIQLLEEGKDFYFVSYHDHYPSPYVIDVFESMMVYDAEDAISIRLFKLDTSKFLLAEEAEESLFNYDYELIGPSDRATHGALTLYPDAQVCPAVFLHAQMSHEEEAILSIKDFPNEGQLDEFSFIGSYPMEAITNGSDGNDVEVMVVYEDGTEKNQTLEFRFVEEMENTNYQEFLVDLDESKKVIEIQVQSKDAVTNAFDWFHMCNPVFSK
jgi:hypothetical protein